MGKAGSRRSPSPGSRCMAAGAFWLSRATRRERVLGAGCCPGWPLLGAGSGLAFPSAQVTGLSAVRPRKRAGLGLMTTMHELGAALGAAIFPAIAAGVSGSPCGGGLRRRVPARLARSAAATAAALAVLAAVALPNARPAPGTRVGMH